MTEAKRTTIMRDSKKMVGIMAAIAIFYGIVQVLNYMYVNPYDSWYQRLILHDFYEDKGQIENLYLGSSHVYCDIDPMYLDDINGKFNFNLATPSQLPNGTFHLLREADRYNELSHAYVELYYYLYVPKVSSEEPIYSMFSRTWQNSDYMRLSVNKLVYMFSIARPGQYTDLCIPFSRYRIKLADWDYIYQTMNMKQQKEYIDYERSLKEGEYKYIRKGRWMSEKVLDDCDKLLHQEHILEDNPMGETSEQYLRKTIEYCQMRDIPITLFISPIYELQLISTDNYDNYIDEVREIAEEYDIEFYDFNLAREEYLPIQYGAYFRDIEHLNNNGANMFTSFFYEVVSGGGKEVDSGKYFYDSYAEKLQNAVPEIYGIYYRDCKDAVEGEEPMKTVWIASNRDSGMEYRIIITPNEGEQYMIQDFDENKEFALPMSETGVCTIVARMKESPDDVQTLEIYF